MADFETARQNQLDKIAELQELGINPYPSSFSKTHTVKESLEMEGESVQTAGKLMSFRTHGNIAFANLKDETGKIQLFFKKEILGDEKYKLLKLIDIGDFVGVTGEVMKTQTGETSIAPKEITLLSKSLLTLPNEFYGIKDVESRYRQRYLDLLINPDVRERFNVRTKIIRSIRNYLDSLSFWEVETPILQPLYGGANAKPFTTHLNALNVEMYLRIAVELYLKRLIIGGYERVYEIGKDFRNEGMDRTHNPEFTMIEWYEAYANYQRVMDVAEGLFKKIAEDIHGHTKINIDQKEIDLGGKWPRIEMTKIMQEKLGIEVDTMSLEELLAYAKDRKIEMVGGETKGQAIFVIFEHTIPGLLIEPTWIIDYPEDVSPLCKSHPDKPGWVERFEGYIGGKEICDGWSELNDPIIQRARFMKDLQAARADKEEAQQIDEDFLTAMEYGMPPLGGIGIGIERLCMFFTNTWAIKEVMLFPTLRPEINQTTKKFEDVKNRDIFSISKELSEKISSLTIGVAVIKNVTIQKNNEELQKRINAFLDEQKELTNEQIGEYSEIKSYRKLYKEMGVDWHSRRPSPEALLRRVVQKKPLYNVNTVVDAYNYIVMKNHISVGAFDLDKLQFPTQLRYGKNEKILLLGDSEGTEVKPSEVVYADNDGPYNLDFNYRDAQRTSVTEDTKNLVINIDGVYDITRQQIEQTLQEVIDIILEFNGGEVVMAGIVSA